MIEKKTLSTGVLLYSEGHLAESLFLIQKGAIALRRERGQRIVELGKASSGQVVGELSFFTQTKRQESAITLSFVEVIEIPYADLGPLYLGLPDYLKSIMNGLAKRVVRVSQTIEQLQIEKQGG